MTHRSEEGFKFRPIRGRLIVQAIEDPDIQNGIVILDRQKDLPQIGVVKSVGSGFINDRGEEEPLPFSPGDKIYFHKYAGQSFDLDGEKYLIVDEEKVLGICEER